MVAGTQARTQSELTVLLPGGRKFHDMNPGQKKRAGPNDRGEVLRGASLSSQEAGDRGQFSSYPVPACLGSGRVRHESLKLSSTPQLGCSSVRLKFAQNKEHGARRKKREKKQQKADL